MKRRKLLLSFLFALFLQSADLLAEENFYCGLNNPTQDIQHFFPESTSFKTRDYIIRRKSPSAQSQDLKKQIERDQELAAFLPANLDSWDHIFYLAYRNQELIGILNCTVWNEREVFVGYKLSSGDIQAIYFQSFDDESAQYFRDSVYLNQYHRFTLDQLPDYKRIFPPQRIPSEKILKMHRELIKLVHYNAVVTKFALRHGLVK